MEIETKMGYGKLFGMTIYECGPMEAVADNGISWRRELTPFLQSLGCGIFDPTAKPTEMGVETLEERAYLENLRHLIKTATNKEQRNVYLQQAHEFCKEIVSIDLRLVDLSSLIIAYIDRDVFMTGSFIEVAHARLQRKPVIIMCKQGIDKIPGFLFGLCEYKMFFDNWDDVRSYLTEVNEQGSTLPSWKFLNYSQIYNKGI